MLEALTTLGTDPAAEPDLLRAIEDFGETVRASLRSEGARRLVDAADDAVCADVANSIAFDGVGRATITVPGAVWSAGTFTVPTLAELQRSVQPAEGAPRLFVLHGEGAVTDIGALQAFAPPGTLFLVASQFNCLESPGAHVTPVQRYLTDPTQGPRASISALPGTLLRHYAAPARDGRRFTQSTRGEQLNLLADAIGDPAIARVCSGYLRDCDVNDPEALVRALSDRFERLQVGLHDDVSVVLGASWHGDVPPDVRVSQAFSSTLAAGGYSRASAREAPWPDVCQLLLRGGYLGTLLGARALKRRVAVLTLLGGGVFGNPLPLIWESILWAFDTLAARFPGALDVVVNTRSLARDVSLERLAQEARDRGGVVLELTLEGPRVLR
jgi:hypothetical protein